MDLTSEGWRSHVADIVKGLIGALIGALLAFTVERCARHAESEDANLEAGLLVLAALEDMETTFFASYCVSVLPHKGTKRAWLELDSNPGHFPRGPSLDAPSVSFMLSDGGFDIYEQLSSAHAAYAEYEALVSRRNRLLFEVIYPFTDQLSKEEQARPDFEKRVVDAIGRGPVEQAHQGALAMLATQQYMRVVGEARSAIYDAMKRSFDDDDVPEMRRELWPAGTDEPNCEVVERDGSFGRVRSQLSD